MLVFIVTETRKRENCFNCGAVLYNVASAIIRNNYQSFFRIICTHYNKKESKIWPFIVVSFFFCLLVASNKLWFLVSVIGSANCGFYISFELHGKKKVLYVVF